MDVSLTFLGAAGTVTGSKFLLRTDTAQVLIDAGLFRLKALRRRNWDSLGLPVPSLDAAVISHAHLDHCGYLPALVRQGFNGPVFMTADTAALAEIVLRDSAKLQEEDAKYASSRGFSKHSKPKPLYDLDDVERTCHCSERSISTRPSPSPMKSRCGLCPQVTFWDPPHR